jgi:superfamily II DNA/RNA helicase
MQFCKLGLCQNIERALKENAYINPTSIQEKVIPLVLQHHDILVRAQTGSGKTASFVLPILQHLSCNRGEGKAKIKVLVLTPTRELTIQVAQAFSLFGQYLPVKPRVVNIIGGESIGDQLYQIQQGCDILVATSGRFLDVLSKKQTNLDKLEFFVLDEAEKMLDLGFAQELENILEAIPKKRQNLLFSATYPPKMQTIVSRITSNPLEIFIEHEEPTVSSITQRAIEVNRQNRGPLLRHLLNSEKWQSVLVFMANKRASDNISAKFRKYGFEAYSFNGDLPQEERNETLDAFKAKKFNILFATDLASRGIDVDNIECVINFDLPRSPTDYIHRIGRTGRAGKDGIAISFIGHEDANHFNLIEKRSQIKLQKEQISGYELTGDIIVKEKGKSPVKGKGKSKKDKAREKALKEAK